MAKLIEQDADQEYTGPMTKVYSINAETLDIEEDEVPCEVLQVDLQNHVSINDEHAMKSIESPDGYTVWYSDGVEVYVGIKIGENIVVPGSAIITGHAIKTKRVETEFGFRKTVATHFNNPAIPLKEFMDMVEFVKLEQTAEPVKKASSVYTQLANRLVRGQFKGGHYTKENNVRCVVGDDDGKHHVYKKVWGFTVTGRINLPKSTQFSTREVVISQAINSAYRYNNDGLSGYDAPFIEAMTFDDIERRRHYVGRSYKIFTEKFIFEWGETTWKQNPQDQTTWMKIRLDNNLRSWVELAQNTEKEFKMEYASQLLEQVL
jgi:hypothetical protein